MLKHLHMLSAARQAYVMMMQLTHVLYTQCSSDNRPAKNLTSYSKPINYYGRYKLGLQLNETLTSNHRQWFKCPNFTVTSNRAERLNSTRWRGHKHSKIQIAKRKHTWVCNCTPRMAIKQITHIHAAFFFLNTTLVILSCMVSVLRLNNTIRWLMCSLTSLLACISCLLTWTLGV
jgi:hypothetical protein